MSQPALGEATDLGADDQNATAARGEKPRAGLLGFHRAGP